MLVRPAAQLSENGLGEPKEVGLLADVGVICNGARGHVFDSNPLDYASPAESK
jgi:hypothetical protein